jgi:hypothetical protein
MVAISLWQLKYHNIQSERFVQILQYRVHMYRPSYITEVQFVLPYAEIYFKFNNINQFHTAITLTVTMVLRAYNRGNFAIFFTK